MTDTKLTLETAEERKLWQRALVAAMAAGGRNCEQSADAAVQAYRERCAPAPSDPSDDEPCVWGHGGSDDRDPCKREGDWRVSGRVFCDEHAARAAISELDTDAWSRVQADAAEGGYNRDPTPSSAPRVDVEALRALAEDLDDACTEWSSGWHSALLAAVPALGDTPSSPASEPACRRCDDTGVTGPCAKIVPTPCPEGCPKPGGAPTGPGWWLYSDEPIHVVAHEGGLWAWCLNERGHVKDLVDVRQLNSSWWAGPCMRGGDADVHRGIVQALGLHGEDVDVTRAVFEIIELHHRSRRLTTLIGALVEHRDDLDDHVAGGCAGNVPTLSSWSVGLTESITAAKGDA